MELIQSISTFCPWRHLEKGIEILNAAPLGGEDTRVVGGWEEIPWVIFILRGKMNCYTGIKYNTACAEGQVDSSFPVRLPPS